MFATVTLDDANISAPDESDHAAIHCLGSAHIILNNENNEYNIADAGFNSNYPAVLAAHNVSGIGEEYTLTISGSGSLDANSLVAVESAVIGGGNEIPCGNIVIAGGTIYAEGGQYAAGIGSGYNSSSGTVKIAGSVMDDDQMRYGVMDSIGDLWSNVPYGPGDPYNFYWELSKTPFN